MIVLDTDALIFWILKDTRLSHNLQKRLSREELYIGPISLWEIALKQKQGKLILPWSAREIHNRLGRVANIEEYPANGELWITSYELDWQHRDPADRLIVSLALRLACDLASTDSKVQAFYPRTVS